MKDDASKGRVLIALPRKTISDRILAGEDLSFADIAYCLSPNKAQQREIIAGMTRDYLAGDLRAKADDGELQHLVKMNDGSCLTLCSSQYIKLQGQFEVIHSPYLHNFKVSPSDYLAYLGDESLPTGCYLNKWIRPDEYKSLFDIIADRWIANGKSQGVPAIPKSNNIETTGDDPKFNRVIDEYLFTVWCDCGKPTKPQQFKNEIKKLRNHKNCSLVGGCYGAGTKGQDQWTCEIVINGQPKLIPYGTLGNKIRDFRKRVNPLK